MREALFLTLHAGMLTSSNAPLAAALRSGDRAYVIGEASGEIADALRAAGVPFVVSGDLETAVRQAAAAAAPQVNPADVKPWGRGRMHLPTIHKLRLDAAGASVSGSINDSGFTVVVPGRKVMESGPPRSTSVNANTSVILLLIVPLSPCRPRGRRKTATRRSPGVSCCAGRRSRGAAPV